MRKCILLVSILMGLLQASHAQAPENPKDYTSHVVGYAHMDMAWLWGWDESIHDIMYNTIRNQLRLTDQYPDYTFAQDQAVVFDSVEHYYPELFQEIIQKVKKGRFIPVSSSWVQMDENMVDGESLVRQFLYGQKYSKEKFGNYIRVAWQTDSFGHPVTMPQIAKKAGVDFYVFTRPHDAMRPPIISWKGLDGTQILGYTIPGEHSQPIDHEHTTVLAMKSADQAGVKDIMVLYGMGDHGGGPNPDDLAGIAKLNTSPDDVHVKPSNVTEYVDLLSAREKGFPLFDKEMNFVFPGCYTTQVEMKRHNRQAEQLLLNAEKMSELAVLFDYRAVYPNRDLTEAWKIALLNQSHDLIGGSGIGPIYSDAARQYQEVFQRANRALTFSLENLGLQLDTRGEGIPVVVYNPQSWDRNDLVTVQISSFSLPKHMVAIHDDEVVPVQVIHAAPMMGSREYATVAFVAHGVPQMGLKLYRLVPADGTHKVSVPSAQAGMQPRPFLENEFFKVEINPDTGNISRLYDKANKREAFTREGNSLVALEDTAEQAMKTSTEYGGPAWDIGLTGKQWDTGKPTKLAVIENGPTRVTIRVAHRFRDSEFIQDISLIAGVPRVDVQISTDWQERSTFLKVRFPIGVTSSQVSSDVPYGAIEREQTGNEMVMGKWVDISDAKYGVAILNDGRNGFDAKDNVIRLSVIRGPWRPDPRADEGLHSFGYSIYPHRGDWRDGKVEFHAMAFNSPLLAQQEPTHAKPEEPWPSRKQKPSGLPPAYSFIKTDSDHVALYSMKQMEGFYDHDAIIRFVELEGREGDVTIEFSRSFKITETNLLEDIVLGPVGENSSIHFHMKPWEIKTMRIAKE